MWSWLKWEFGRTIEVTTFIKLIIAERGVKFLLLVGGGILLLVAGDGTTVRDWVQQAQEQINFNPNHAGLWRRAIDYVLLKLGGLSPGQQDVLAVAAILYGVLEGLEGLGLILRRRWAEYLVLVATVAFLPLEIDELFHRVTLFKVGALFVNIAIAAYLIWRKRLFLERPGQPPVADVTSVEPVV